MRSARINQQMTKDISLNLLEQYTKKLNSYDEVLDTNGKVKPYWKNLFETLEAVGMQELELRNEEIINQLRENGVTYNVYDSSNESNRAWKLDPIPFLIHQREWQSIEKGLKQRANLLDLVYQDIYGAQSLIKEGIIPPRISV